jgi:hypothetical protein
VQDVTSKLKVPGANDVATIRIRQGGCQIRRLEGPAVERWLNDGDLLQADDEVRCTTRASMYWLGSADVEEVEGGPAWVLVKKGNPPLSVNRALASDVVQALNSDSNLDVMEIQVYARGDTVFLTATASKQQGEEIERVVRTVPGVVAVHSNFRRP